MEYPQLPEWELLTRACLSEERDEIEKISSIWSEKANPHDMDYKSMRLIPYFLDHLKKYNLDVPHENRLNVIYKYWWLKSNWILHELDRITELFHLNRIPILVIKGAALNKFYEKPIHRTMVDIDILIPEKHIIKAYELLTVNGFRGFYKTVMMYKKFTRLAESNLHAFYLIDKKSGLEIDLHWKLGNKLSDEFLECVWKNAIPDRQNIKRLSAPKYLLFIMNAINGYMSQDHHGNWLLDSKILLSSFSIEDKDELTKFLAKQNFPIWPHINFYLSQFDINYQPISEDYKQNLNLIPVWYDVRDQPNLKKTFRAVIQNYKFEKVKCYMVNSKFSVLNFLVWKVITILYFPFKSINKEIKEWPEYTNI